jgi:hypothetical protein
MPRNNNVPAVPNRSALDDLPADMRADLLRAQAEQVSTFQRPPRLKIMGAGAGLYEFTDTNDTTREVRGVILNSHARNVLWDRSFDDRPTDDEDSGPACNSPDGRFGTPRRGFRHVELGGRAAEGTERIDCSTCRYNQWGSVGLINPSREGQKGKATTNQRSIYILVEDRESPVELILPPTSLPEYDRYLMALANQQIPVQAVLTIFKQEVKSRGAQRWGVAKFENGGILEGEVFTHVMQKRQQYMNVISPPDMSGAAAAEVPEGMLADDDEPLF